MNQESQDLSLPRPPAGDGVVTQLLTLLRALRGSAYRRRLTLLTIGIVVVICANAAGQIRLNVGQRAFYDAIAQKHVAAFMSELLVFAVIAGGLLVLVVAQTWLQEMIKVRLREWVTHDLLDQWLDGPGDLGHDVPHPPADVRLDGQAVRGGARLVDAHVAALAVDHAEHDRRLLEHRLEERLGRPRPGGRRGHRAILLAGSRSSEVRITAAPRRRETPYE